MSDLLLANGTVLGPDGPVEADVRVTGDTIAEVGSGLDPAGTEVLDCTGCWVGPGLVDLHAHFREPGQEWKEDIETGSRAAAAGGYTAAVAMPNTDPPVDSGHLARYVADRGRQVGLIEVAPAGCITMGREGAKLAHVDEMFAAGVRIFTDDGDAVADSGVVRRAMEYLAEVGGTFAQHAEDPALVAGAHMHEGGVSSLLGMAGRPAAAEEIVIARDLTLVRLTGARYHVLHLSTAAGVELVRRAKEEGLDVTAEVTPHHLFFDHHDVKFTDPAFKMNPPLRSEADLAALREGLADGTIDAIGTDHAPHSADEKDVPFEEAPPGIIGLETAAAAVLMAGDLGIAEFFDRMSVAPARIAGLDGQGRSLTAGAPANVVVFDPLEVWTPEATVSRAVNTPFLGRELQGRARFTVFAGRLTWSDAKVQA